MYICLIWLPNFQSVKSEYVTFCFQIEVIVSIYTLCTEVQTLKDLANWLNFIK